jgi:hypothetical protein
MQLSPAIFFCFNSLVINAFRLLSELYNTFIIPYFFCVGMIFYAFFCLCYIKYLYLH